MRSFLLSLSLGLAACASPSFAAQPKLTGFSQVSEKVYRGGRPSNDAEFQLLKNTYGVKTVINLQGEALKIIPGETEKAIEKSRELAERNGLRFFNLAFPAITKLTPEDEQVILQAAALMDDPQMGKVYVHCNVGADRTGILVAAYRILYQNCSYRKAKKEMLREGAFWTGLFSLWQKEYLKELEENRAQLVHGTVLNRACPL